jgi:hypothetical protein
MSEPIIDVRALAKQIESIMPFWCQDPECKICEARLKAAAALQSQGEQNV